MDSVRQIPIAGRRLPTISAIVMVVKEETSLLS